MVRRNPRKQILADIASVNHPNGLHFKSKVFGLDKLGSADSCVEIRPCIPEPPQCKVVSLS